MFELLESLYLKSMGIVDQMFPIDYVTIMFCVHFTVEISFPPKKIESVRTTSQWFMSRVLSLAAACSSGSDTLTSCLQSLLFHLKQQQTFVSNVFSWPFHTHACFWDVHWVTNLSLQARRPDST